MSSFFQKPYVFHGLLLAFLVTPWLAVFQADLRVNQAVFLSLAVLVGSQVVRRLQWYTSNRPMLLLVLVLLFLVVAKYEFQAAPLEDFLKDPSSLPHKPLKPGGHKALRSGGGFPFTGEVSVIFPCASEGEFMAKSIRSVIEYTPHHLLKEIIVVDDGSQTAQSSYLTPEEIEEYQIKFIVNPQTIGLQGSKKKGGDAAEGSILFFLDCHIRPEEGWLQPVVDQISEDPKLVVVPTIGAVDPHTWQILPSGDMSKCYMTWDSDFKWFDHPILDTMPVPSGGLLAMSKTFWDLTGGYDMGMKGWGGENIDQALRIWLCGGRIKNIKQSRVAHMWRDGSLKTRTHYTHVGNSNLNRYRAAKAWFDRFTLKTLQYPDMAQVATAYEGKPALDVSSFDDIRERNTCKPFAYFLKTFALFYEGAGLLPEEVFTLRETQSNKCLTGYTPYGSTGTLRLEPCFGKNSWPGDVIPADRLSLAEKIKHVNRYRFAQRFHIGNLRPHRRTDGGRRVDPFAYKLDEPGDCCSGIRVWNSDQCITSPRKWSESVNTATCRTDGHDSSQYWEFDPQTHEVRDAQGHCLTGSNVQTLSQHLQAELVPCSTENGIQLVGDQYMRDGLCLAADGSRAVFKDCKAAKDDIHLKPLKDSMVQVQIGSLCLETEKGLSLKLAKCQDKDAQKYHWIRLVNGEYAIREIHHLCVGPEVPPFKLSTLIGVPFKIEPFQDKLIRLVNPENPQKCLSHRWSLKTRAQIHANYKTGMANQEVLLFWEDCTAAHSREIWSIETKGQPLDLADFEGSLSLMSPEGVEPSATDLVDNPRNCIDHGENLIMYICHYGETQLFEATIKDGLLTLEGPRPRELPEDSKADSLEGVLCDDSRAHWVKEEIETPLETLLYMEDIQHYGL